VEAEGHRANATGQTKWSACGKRELVLQISADIFGVEDRELELKEKCRILESIIYDPRNGWYEASRAGT
jgi:hypothetical protein